jgi:hypothetical protein
MHVQITRYYFEQFEFKIGDWWANSQEDKASYLAFQSWLRELQKEGKINRRPFGRRDPRRLIRKLTFVVYPRALPRQGAPKTFCFGEPKQIDRLKSFVTKIQNQLTGLESLVFEVDYTSTRDQRRGGIMPNWREVLGRNEMVLQFIYLLRKICNWQRCRVISVLQNNLVPMHESAAYLQAVVVPRSQRTDPTKTQVRGSEALEQQAITMAPSRPWFIKGV